MVALVFGWLVVAVGLVLLLGALFVSPLAGRDVLVALGLGLTVLGAALVGAGIVAARLDRLALDAPGRPPTPASDPGPPPPARSSLPFLMFLLLFVLIVGALSVYFTAPEVFTFEWMRRP